MKSLSVTNALFIASFMLFAACGSNATQEVVQQPVAEAPAPTPTPTNTQPTTQPPKNTTPVAQPQTKVPAPTPAPTNTQPATQPPKNTTPVAQPQTKAPAPTPAPTNTRPTTQRPKSTPPPPVAQPAPVIQAYERREHPSFITINNLKEQSANIPKIAWDDSQRLLQSTRGKGTLPLDVMVGPTTELYFDDSESAFQQAIDFWSPYKMPKKYIAMLYSFDDLQWAKDVIVGLGYRADRAEAPCRDGKCTGANSGLQPDAETGLGTLGVHAPDARDAYRYGPLQVHEFTHTAVASQWINLARNPQESANQSGPCWMNEGLAHFAGLSVNLATYDAYLDMRQDQVKARHQRPPGEDYSKEWILTFYDDSYPPQCIGRQDYVLGYSIGYLTTEALSAIAGSYSAMDLYTYLSLGKTFDEAFEIIYGISWDESKVILADYVSATIQSMFQ